MSKPVASCSRTICVASLPGSHCSIRSTRSWATEKAPAYTTAGARTRVVAPCSLRRGLLCCLIGGAAMSDWDPALSHRFRRYRAEPFEAIMARLGTSGGEQRMVNRICDLGCGTGENTVELSRRFACGATGGLDSSPAMIDRALKLREGLEPSLRERLSFVFGDIREFNAQGEHSREYSMVFSNAA